MTQGDDFFTPWEKKIEDWDSALKCINLVISRAGDKHDLVWRGVVDASYSLHSSLYRRFIANPPGHPIDELDFVEFERKVLDASRNRWRYGDKNALEMLAQLQHFGAQTRLIDVTFNPLVALWFAVEQKFDESDNKDGRLFAFDVTTRKISLDAIWGHHILPWEKWQKEVGWRCELPYLWRPPSYNERIPVQHSAFLVGGVPMAFKGYNAWYRKGPGDGPSKGLWGIRQIHESTSIPVRMVSLDQTAQERSAPTFTLRVNSDAKAKIRALLDHNFGLNTATIYPDLYGLARHVSP